MEVDMQNITKVRDRLQKFGGEIDFFKSWLDEFATIINGEVEERVSPSDSDYHCTTAEEAESLNF
jgi:hypothetical protein